MFDKLKKILPSLKGLFKSSTEDNTKPPITLEVGELVHTLSPLIKLKIVDHESNNLVSNAVFRLQDWLKLAPGHIRPTDFDGLSSTLWSIHESLPKEITDNQQTFDVEYETAESLVTYNDVIGEVVRNMRKNHPDENMSFDEDQFIDTAYLDFEKGEDFSTMANKLTKVNDRIALLMLKHGVVSPTHDHENNQPPPPPPHNSFGNDWGLD